MPRSLITALSKWQSRLPWQPRRSLRHAGSGPRWVRPSLEDRHGPPITGSGPLARDASLALIEAALFVADEPLHLRKLAQVVQVKEIETVRRLVKRLQGLYVQENSALEVREIAGGYQILTRPEYHPWLARFRPTNNDSKLTLPALETLAIVAYKQPVSRADVEAIRGVACGEILRQLLESDLIRITGRDTSLGRPVLYGTTKTFLQMVGLNTLADLPAQGNQNSTT